MQRARAFVYADYCPIIISAGIIIYLDISIASFYGDIWIWAAYILDLVHRALF